MAVLCLFLFWITVSSAVQEDAISNLICSCVYAGMVVILCVKSHTWLIRADPQRLVGIITGLLFCSMLLSLAFTVVGAPFPMSHQGRFGGVYVNAIVAGQMAALATILSFWRLHSTRANRWIWLCVLIPSATVLILTRTRTALASTAIAVIVIYWRGCLRRERAALNIFGMAVFLLFAVGLGINVLSEDQRATIRRYLRVDGSVTDIMGSRRVYWESGTEELKVTNVFGQGYLAVFGGTLDYKSSGYDADTNPLNSFLRCAQSYGIVGLGLWVAFLVLITYNFFSRADHWAVLGSAILLHGLITSISENWLLSFGHPADRITWALLGICLCVSVERQESRGGTAEDRCLMFSEIQLYSLISERRS